MKRLYKGFIAGALAVTVLCAPINVAAKTTAVVQTAKGEQTVTYYAVRFDANKGKKVTSTLDIAGGDTYGTLPKTTRDGYEFTGWYTKKSGGTKVTAKSVFQGTDDQVLYAHWKKVVTEEAGEISKTPAASDTPESSEAVQTLVTYSSNSKVDYRKDAYSSFLVLKNFKAKYVYCQGDYKRFVNSRGKNVGCTATADAMLASIYTDKPFSPNDEGWISGVGATWTNSVVADGSGSYSVKRQCQAVYDFLNEGKPVLIRVVGHSVTAIGVRKGVNRTSITPADILIADPADGKVKCADEMGYRVMTGANGWGLRIPKSSLVAK